MTPSKFIGDERDKIFTVKRKQYQYKKKKKDAG